MANDNHSEFVAKALARSRWQDETRWKEVILEAAEFIDCYLAAGRWTPTPRATFGISGRGYSEPPTVIINPAPEMVERVARRICSANGHNYDRLVARRVSGELDQADYDRFARAAIEAMREPTEAMLRPAGWLDNGYAMTVTEGIAEEVWRTMIDAALRK